LIDEAGTSESLLPTGFTDSLTPVAQFIEWLQPALVLDVGVGRGRMGFLAREYGHIPWHRERRATALSFTASKVTSRTLAIFSVRFTTK
jgi:hypothetical protein